MGGITTLKHWPVEYVLLELPLAQLFLLWTENKISSGEQWAEPSYEERDTFDADMEAVMALKARRTR